MLYTNALIQKNIKHSSYFAQWACGESLSEGAHKWRTSIARDRYWHLAKILIDRIAHVFEEGEWVEIVRWGETEEAHHATRRTNAPPGFPCARRVAIGQATDLYGSTSHD